jgi:hypothetical protein
MPALVDAGLVVLLFAGAFFLGVVGLALVRELRNGGKNDNKDSK